MTERKKKLDTGAPRRRRILCGFIGLAIVIASYWMLKPFIQTYFGELGKKAANWHSRAGVSANTNAVFKIFPRLDDVIVPAIGTAESIAARLPLVFWADQGKICDLDAIVIEVFDRHSKLWSSYGGPYATANANERLMFPYRVAEDPKTVLEVQLPFVSTDDPRTKVRVKFVAHESRQSSTVEIMLVRFKGGYKLAVAAQGQLYQSGSLPASEGTVRFLQPYADTNFSLWFRY